MKLTVKQKITLSFSSVIAIMVTIAVLLWFQLTAAHLLEDEVRNDDVPGLTLYLILIDEAGDVFRDALKMVNEFDNAQADFRSNVKGFDQALSDLKVIESNTQSNRNNMKAIETYMQQFVDGVEREIIPNLGNDTAELVARLAKLEQAHLEPLEDLLDKLTLEEKHEAETSLQALANSFTSMESQVITLTLIGTLVSLAVAFLLSKSLISRISNLDQIAQQIAHGDLTSSPIVDNAGDELSNLAKSVNQMQASLQDLVGSISSVGHQVQQVTRDLAQNGDEIVEGATEQANKANLIATASEELSVTIAEVAQQSVTTSDLASDSGTAAKNGRDIIVEMVESIGQVSTQMEQMSGQMNTLGERSEEIGSVIKVIEDIAEQTNLLALNAAIEAARAGELGRGFAVVADEVRALAERTTQATNEVGGIIQAIQTGTREAVNVTTESRQLVEIGVSQSAGAGSALEQIVTSAHEVQEMIHSIATATEEQTAVTREIATDITVINDISEQSLQLASRSSSHIQDLEGKVQELEALLAKFKV